MKTAGVDLVDVVAADYVAELKLKVTFSDGAEKVIDFGSFLSAARNPSTTDFRNVEKFKSFKIQDGNLMWGDYQMIFPVIDLYRGEVR